jgi:hypothetical protein
MAEFRMEVFQNEFLPEGANTMHAVLTVTASATGASGPAVEQSSGPGRAEMIVVDTSGSMSGRKLRAVKAATAAAIDCLPDGVSFGIITGNHKALVAYPPTPPLAVSSPATREAAKHAVKAFEARGGTAIGSWVHLSAHLLREQPGIRHAILLTDGKNETEGPEVLDGILADVEGQFQCDCRGVGADWEVSDLRKIATALSGSYDIVADASGLAADFASMMEASLRKQVAEVGLRVWTPQGAEVITFKQMEPIILDLSPTRTSSGPMTGDYATGSWGDESRDYFLSVRVPAGGVDDEMLAARVTLLVGGEPAGQALIRAVWTDDTAKSTRIDRRVAGAMGETELADVIQEGIDAHRAGDIDTATDRFGRAVRLATESGNDETVDRLSKVVEIEDAATGRVRPRPKVEDVDVMIVETRSTRTSRTNR